MNKVEMIVDCPADPPDTLRLLGIEALARYVVDEVQEVYRLQGVKIKEKANMASELHTMEGSTAVATYQSDDE